MGFVKSQYTTHDFTLRTLFNSFKINSQFLSDVPVNDGVSEAEGVDDVFMKSLFRARWFQILKVMNWEVALC